MPFDKQGYMTQYNAEYYEKKKAKLLKKQKAKRAVDYFDKDGHAKAIYSCLKRYKSKWKLPIASYSEFRAWIKNDPAYEELFKTWEESKFDRSLTPVVMRKVKKRGFVTNNLYCSTKGQHSWWNGLLEEIRKLNREMDVRQAENNRSTEEEKENMRERLRRVRGER